MYGRLFKLFIGMLILSTLNKRFIRCVTLFISKYIILLSDYYERMRSFWQFYADRYAVNSFTIRRKAQHTYFRYILVRVV